jgi:hypothetical protein
MVHCRILEEALDGQNSVGFRNLTAYPTLKEFQDLDPLLRKSRVSYGIMLEPSPGSDGLFDRLVDLAGNHIDITHFPLFGPTPLGISIMAQACVSNWFEGQLELANWVRAHFRHLEELVTRLGHGKEYPLPALPIVRVWGGEWKVDFAYRCCGKTVIYKGLPVGSTGTVYGCYQICAAVRRLAAWIREDLRGWWLGAVRVPTMSHKRCRLE